MVWAHIKAWFCSNVVTPRAVWVRLHKKAFWRNKKSFESVNLVIKFCPAAIVSQHNSLTENQLIPFWTPSWWTLLKKRLFKCDSYWKRYSQKANLKSYTFIYFTMICCRKPNTCSSFHCETKYLSSNVILLHLKVWYQSKQAIVQFRLCCPVDL